MLKQIFESYQNTIYQPHILTLLHKLTYYILTAKLYGNALTKTRIDYLFQLESFVDKQLSSATHYSICYIMYSSILYLNPLILTK